VLKLEDAVVDGIRKVNKSLELEAIILEVALIGFQNKPTK